MSSDPRPARGASDRTLPADPPPTNKGTVASFGLQIDLYPFLGPPAKSGHLGTLGPYAVVAELGQGGMGVVFRAEDPKLRREVALKVMRPEVAANPLARDRFVREARAQAAVDHDHVLPIFQVDDGPTPYLVMPLLRGQTLSAALKKDPYPPLAEVCRIGRQIALGLAAAHARGLIHRDIKPGNVWLEGDRRRVKILDFGLARAADDEADQPVEAAVRALLTDGTDLTRTGAVVGTPAYMAPEQAAGAAVDHRADLWSLGVILFQMGTGRLPFTGATVQDVVAAVISAPTPDLSDLPTELAELVARLLAKDPAGRPASADAVADALRTIEQGTGVHRALPAVRRDPSVPDIWVDMASTEREEATAPVRRRRPANPWVAPAWAALAACLLLFTGGLFYQVFVKTPHGTLVIDAPDPDVEVKVTKNGAVVIDKTTKREITLEAGRYGIELAEKKDGLRLTTSQFEITKDGRTAVAVRLEKAKEAAKPKEVTRPAADADRRAAEALLPHAIELTVARPDGTAQTLKPADPLPDGPFTLAGVNVSGRQRPADFVASVLLPAVDRLTGLERVSVHDITLSAADLGRLAAGPWAARVKLLNVPATPLTQATAAQLKRFPAVEDLGLTVTAESPPAMDALADLPALRSVELHPSDPAPPKLPLGRLSGRPLTGLTLRGWAGFPPGLAADLAALPALTALDLHGSRLTDEDLAALAAAPKLRNIWYLTGPLTPGRADALARSRSLRMLFVADTSPATVAEAKRLAARLPRCQIRWDGGGHIDPTDAGRTAAETLLPFVDWLRVRREDGQEQTVRRTDALPDGELSVTGMSLFGRHDLPPGFVSKTLIPTVARCPEVRHLMAVFPPVSADDMAKLAASPAAASLHAISFWNPKFPAAGFDCLPAFRNLSELHLGATELGTPQLARLAELPKLRTLGLFGNPRPGTDFAALSKLPVTVLWLRRADKYPVTLFEAVRRMPALETLDLFASRVTDDMLAALAGAPRLKTMYGLDGPLTPARVQKLAALSGLEKLSVTNPAPDVAARAKELSAKLSRCRIEWDGGAIGPGKE